MSRGKEFEQIVAEIEEILNKHPDVEIQKDVRLLTSYGAKRQIDILLIDRRGRFEFRTIIECKDLNKKIDLNIIGAFKDVMRSVKAHNGIMVSKSGFAPNVLKSASELNILLYELSKVSEITLQLENTKVIFQKNKLTSKEIIISFLRVTPINKEITLRTTLLDTEKQIHTSILKISECFLEMQSNFIIENMLLEVNNFNVTQITSHILTFKINFPTPLIYATKQGFTEIIGFRATIQCDLETGPTEVDFISEYKDVVSKQVHAYVYNVLYDGEKFKYIDKTGRDNLL